MKTAISIPDRLFNAAEEAARRLDISRSELYARALEEYLAARREAEVTNRLNEVYTQAPARVDPLLAKMQFASLPDDTW
jgi:metal-responsive CopG/Arc/MetJ family transcriptional regulator